MMLVRRRGTVTKAPGSGPNVPTFDKVAPLKGVSRIGRKALSPRWQAPKHANPQFDGVVLLSARWVSGTSIRKQRPSAMSARTGAGNGAHPKPA